MNTVRINWGAWVVLAWLIWSLPLAASAQTLRFERDSLPVVLRQARQLQKSVLVVVAPPTVPKVVDRSGEAVPQRWGLQDAEVASVLQRDFLVVELQAGTATARSLQRQYDIRTFPTYLYLAPDGTPLRRGFGYVSSPSWYLKEIEAFRQTLASPDNLSRLTQRYAQGERAPAFQRLYLEALRQVGLPITATLLDGYVRELTVKDLDSFEQIRFLHACGPVVDSRAFRLARFHQRLVDSLYKTLPLAERVELNNRIIDNTRREAIRLRDATLALKGANFARSTWTGGRSWRPAQRTFYQNLLSYYTAVGDTARLLPQLNTYIEQLYLQLPIDTVRRDLLQRRQVQQVRDVALPYAHLLPDSAAGTSRREVRLGGPDPYAADLNNAAWQVYTTGTRRPLFLDNALRWSQRSIAADPQANYYDTLAHLLYRLQFFAEAEAQQQHAVELAQRTGQDATAFRQELQRLKARKL